MHYKGVDLSQTYSEFVVPRPTFTEENLPDLTDKVYLITGGTSGIGFELAKLLYAKNARVYITSRSEASATKAIEEIKAAISASSASSSPSSSPKGTLSSVILDLTDLNSVVTGARSFLAKESILHCVWYNAGVMTPPEKSKTKQNYELQWGTNVVAHFLLNRFLTPLLLKAADLEKRNGGGSVRAIWVSSVAHANAPAPDGVDWDDIVTKKDDGDASSSSCWKMGVGAYYGQSKAANNILAREFAKRHAQDGLVSVSLNPGNLKSNLNRHFSSLAVWFMNTTLLYDTRYGALTELYAGFTPDISLENNGAYVIPWGRIGALRADIEEGIASRGTGQKLWDLLQKETDPYV